MIEGNAFGNKVTKEDFELVGVIGQGSFAKVVEVQKIDTGKTFAMKVLKKKTVVERGQVDHTMSERAALQHSPSMIEGNAFGNKVTKEDFELVGVIGQGSFAK